MERHRADRGDPLFSGGDRDTDGDRKACGNPGEVQHPPGAPEAAQRLSPLAKPRARIDQPFPDRPPPQRNLTHVHHHTAPAPARLCDLAPCQIPVLEATTCQQRSGDISITRDTRLQYRRKQPSPSQGQVQRRCFTLLPGNECLPDCMQSLPTNNYWGDIDALFFRFVMSQNPGAQFRRSHHFRVSRFCDLLNARLIINKHCACAGPRKRSLRGFGYRARGSNY